jgi:glucose/arabinose dehydrogenase
MDRAAPMRHSSRVRASVVVAVVVLSVGRVLAAGEELIPERDGHRLVPRILAPTDARVAQLRLPAGFRIGKFAEGLGQPRIMAVAADGTVYVTRPATGEVLALRDRDGDGRAEDVRPVVRDLPRVHGIALAAGTMYLATIDAVFRAPIRDGDVGAPETILGDLPPGGRHPNRTLGVGPDGSLFVSVGSTCNACVEPSPESAAILRAPPDGGRRAVFARGLRNTIGFAWHPATKALWGVDHGTDWLGDDFPPEELNRLEDGKDYGWPFVQDDGRLLPATRFPDDFDRDAARAKSTPPVLRHTAHSAPMQMVFYTGTQFPEPYRDDAFVAMHGSWNRVPASGFEVVRIEFEAGRPVAFRPFLGGFLVDGGQGTFGRPTGLGVARDGALLVGDDTTGVVYRIAWAP